MQAKIIKLVDVSYGGENGFNQAIELSAEVLSNVKFIQEKKLIGMFIDIVTTFLWLDKWVISIELPFSISRENIVCKVICFGPFSSLGKQTYALN